MGKRGPAPKSAKLRVLEGRAPETALDDEFQPQGGLPLPPDDLTELQVTIWRRVATSMQGFLTLADYDAVRNYCVLQAHLIEIEEKLKTTGNLVTMNGRTTTNPLFRMRNQLVQNVHLIGSSLGLSPAARARIGSAEKDGEAVDLEYLKLIGAA